MLRRKWIVMMLTVLLWAGAAFGDVTIKKQDGGFEETAYYKGPKIAMVSDDGREIVDAAEKTIMIVNPDAKVYAQATLDEYKTVMLDHFKRMGEMQVEMMMTATGLGRAEAEAMLKQQVGAGDPPEGPDFLYKALFLMLFRDGAGHVIQNGKYLGPRQSLAEDRTDDILCQAAARA